MGTAAPRRTIKHLGKEEELELINRWTKHKDRKALDILLKAFDPMLQGMAHSAHRKYQHVLADDFAQNLRMRFITTLETFDPALGYRLATFLNMHLRSAVQIQTRREAMNAVPVDGTSKRIKSTLLAHMAKHPELHTPYAKIFQDVAKQAHVTPARVEEYHMRSLAVSSLNRPLGPDTDTTFMDVVEDHKAVDPGDELDKKKLFNVLEQGISTLPARQQTILRGRFGLVADEEATLRDLSTVFNVSVERIRQIELEGLRELKTYFEDNGYNKAAIAEILTL